MIRRSDKEATREINERRARSITAKIGVIAAYFHRARNGKSLPPVRYDLTEAEHFLYLINGEPQSQEASDTLDVAFVLHADHGTNASTFSARVTISTLSDFYSAITSAIGTLKGPLHGGANEGVIQMLEEIGSEDKVDAYIEKKLANKEKIMGIGHRVYKTLDPRAPHLQRMAIKLSEKLGDPKWINMSERIARVDEGEEEPERERRFLFRDGLLFVGHSDRFVHPGFRHRALRRLVRARPRAARGQPTLSAVERIHRRAGRQEGRSDRPARVVFAGASLGARGLTLRCLIRQALLALLRVKRLHCGARRRNHFRHRAPARNRQIEHEQEHDDEQTDQAEGALNGPKGDKIAAPAFTAYQSFR